MTISPSLAWLAIEGTSARIQNFLNYTEMAYLRCENIAEIWEQVTGVPSSLTARVTAPRPPWSGEVDECRRRITSPDAGVYIR